MKNIFKYLGAFAIAGALGLNTMNVSAEVTCEANEKVHTNYYLFLTVNSPEYYKQKIEEKELEGKSFTEWTGAHKYNNLNNEFVKADGSVGIKDTAGNITVEGATEEWTVVDYWKKYYTAYQNKDANLVYTDGDASYLLHTKWWTYKENWEDGEESTHATTTLADALTSHIQGNWGSLASTGLVTKGTMLPSSKVEMPNNLSTSSDSTQLWKISRVYPKELTIPDGVDLAGQTVVYSPAVYYVKFCVEDTSNDVVETPTGSFTVTYDANGGKDAPAAQTSNDGSCLTISSAKPTLEGNNFLGWSTNKDAREADPDFNAGQPYCGVENITLYAVWQVQSGVSAHLIAFGIVALTAGAALIVAKKKNLFKQI